MSSWGGFTIIAGAIGSMAFPGISISSSPGSKLPLLTVAGFVIGLPLLFRRKLGDGRYFVLFWLYLFFVPFSLPGGKLLGVSSYMDANGDRRE